ncbi:MAG TPA: isopentenyl-diphosphate Delta-isomerase [Ferruginibacter sp.]|nr:isopentenyl-diphosphate Delta-isomerase [Ferruginibacter sp.]HMP19443.1 isopentenyl-diphosphate Delta-isomerase [Ferruginibacter sp.]
MAATAVILVDEQDRELGSMEKIEAHEKALLHRAFSIFIFNAKGEMLLQKRADTKYHSAGLWTNACCSHPAPGQATLAAAQVRLQEEMGFTTTLSKAFTFIYKAPFGNGLTEYEYDHVFTGVYNGNIYPNPEEVSDWRYETIEAIEAGIQQQPAAYTEWFKIAFPKLCQYPVSLH